MTVTSIARPALINLKGAGKVARIAAYESIAPLAYVEAKSRADTLANLRAALGKAPTADEVTVAQREYIIGRVAQRLAVSDLPGGKELAGGDRLDFARKLVTAYAQPLKDGVAAKKLRKGQLGRRSVAQHKAVRAAEETWSLLKAELGLGTARTQQEKNAKQATRAPAMAGATQRGKAGTGVTHSELVKGDGPMTSKAAVDYLNGMAATLLAFCNKHAAVTPTDYGMAVRAFKKAADAASIAYAARAQ